MGSLGTNVCIKQKNSFRQELLANTKKDNFLSLANPRHWAAKLASLAWPLFHGFVQSTPAATLPKNCNANCVFLFAS
eukprot:2190630-Amphidinium_carterae.2